MSSPIGNIDSSMALGRLQAETVAQDRDLARANGTPGQSRAEIKKVAEEFESLFLNLVLKSMRNTVQKSGLVDGGNAEDIYRSMLDDEYSKMMASQRHTGIANQIESFLLESQGIQEAAAMPEGKVDVRAGLASYKGAALQIPEKGATMNDRAPGDATVPRMKSL